VVFTDVGRSGVDDDDDDDDDDVDMIGILVNLIRLRIEKKTQI